MTGKTIKVTAEDVSEQFDALMSRRRPPEDIEAWAGERMRASDEGRLEYDPPSDEDRLWDAILYLLGVGLKTGPDTYLHSVEDFEHYRREAEL